MTTIVRVVSRDPCPELHPGWLRLYRRFPGLFRVLDRPSRWLGVVVVLLLLSTLLGSALFGRQG